MKYHISLSEARKNIAIAIPVAISQLGHMTVAVADTLMAGRLGAMPLAAATLAMSVFIPFFMIAIGMSYGLTPSVAQHDGEGNKVEIAKVLKNGLWLNIIIDVLLVLILLGIAQLFPYLNPDKELVAMAKPFFIIQVLSLLPVMFFLILKQFCEGLAITRQATVITIIANVINIALIYVFIHGTFGVPQLGFNGIAYATLIARTFMMVSMGLFFLLHKGFQPYRTLYKSIKIKSSEMITLLKNSMPIGLQLLLESGAFGFAAILAGWIGANEIAAHQISLNIAAITYMVATGIASATTVRTGNEWGKKDMTALRTASWTALVIIMVYEVICCLFFVVVKDYLPLAYIQDSAIVSLSASLLLITALFQMSDGIQVVAMGALRGIGDVQTPTIVAVISYWIIGLPAGYVLAFYTGMGVQGIWYGLLIGLTASAILLTVRLKRKLQNI